MAQFVKNITYTETLQQSDDNQNALDNVVDPSIEFKYASSDSKSPKEAFNLPEKAFRKHSLSLLRCKQYTVNNELPKVHRSSSNQSINMLKRDTFQRNVSECSSEACTPIPQDVSFSDDNDSPIFPNFNQDKLETASNISLSSNITDIPKSVISSTSDLTGYEEELFQIKKLLIHGSNQSLYPLEDFKNPEDSKYKQKIEELETQLQETLAENEKYKFHLKDLESKVELIWQTKFQTILRQKAQCEGQLENYKKQHKKENLTIIEDKNSLRSDFTKLQTKLNSLEKQNNDLQSRLILSCNESKQWQNEFLKTEAENEKLRTTLQELKSEIDSKNSVLFGLKNKITEQHIELQNQIQGKMKLNNHIATLNNEIESVKKSEKWYKEKLHNCQLVKSNIQQELMSTQTNLITLNQKNENLQIEINHWKNISEETQRKAMREKEKLLRKVEIIEADILERETILKCTQTENNTQIEIDFTKNQDNNQIIIEDYEDQLLNMKKTIEDWVKINDNLKTQNSDYLVRLTTLQKGLNEKEIVLQSLQNRNQDLEMKINNFTEEIRTKNNEILECKNKIVNLEVGLHAANKEKEEIDDVVKNLREDFNKFMKCYQNMKEKLEEKSRIITQFEQEKQELFMENNWRICEIEELQHKVLNIKCLQAEITDLKNICNQTIIEKNQLQTINEDILKKNEALEKDYDNLKQKSNYENEILKLNEVLKTREEQLLNQTKNCELLNNEILEKELFISDLQEKLQESISSLQKENYISSEIEQQNMDLQNKITELNKKLVDSNSVIEQFNTLCRNSESEKYNLKNELELYKNQKNSNKTYNDVKIQTDFQTENAELLSELEIIKLKLLEYISDNNNTSDTKYSPINTNNHKPFDIIYIINDNLNKILNFKEKQVHQIEDNKKTTRLLRAKILKLKNISENKLSVLKERCGVLELKFQQIQNIFDVFITNSGHSVGIQTEMEIKDEQTSKLLQKIKDLKSVLRVNEMEKKEQYKRIELNNRTLLKKCKEHMRGRKTTEKKLSSLMETYNLALKEINASKIINNRLDLELSTFKNRCDEYKNLCDNLNENIIQLEKEKSQSENLKETECVECLDKNKSKEELQDLLNQKEKDVNDKELGLTEYKKQLFNEKLQTSSLKKQVSSIQMCLDNANEQLDNKQIEFGHLKSVIEKLEINEKLLTDQLENAHIQYQECKKKLEATVRLLEEKTAKDDILADEIKTLSCHLHKKTLETNNLINKYSLLETQLATVENNNKKIIEELQENLTEMKSELDEMKNDKFFLQRLSSDLKMSLQGTLNQNRVLKLRLEALENETKNLKQIPSPTKIDEEYIRNLLEQSTVLPTKPLKDLRTCLDSLKQEMTTLQEAIIAKTISNP